MRHAMIAVVSLLLLAVTACHQEAPAQSDSPLEIKIQREIQTKGPDGKDVVKYEPLTGKPQPGDVVYTTLKYDVTQIREGKLPDIVYDVPPDSVFLEAGGEGFAVFVSANGGKDWARHPAVYRAKDKNGKEVLKPVPLRAITKVRWMYLNQLQPGQAGTATLRVKVIKSDATNTPAAPSPEAPPTTPAPGAAPAKP